MAKGFGARVLSGVPRALAQFLSVLIVASALAVAEPAEASSPQPGAPYGTTTSTTVDIDPATVATLAGSGQDTDTDGTGTAASFDSPSSEVLVGSTLYVTDAQSLRAVDTTTGAVSTVLSSVWGGGDCEYTDSPSTADATTCSPTSIVSDGYNLYFVDEDNDGYTTYDVRQLNLSTGAVSTLLDTSQSQAVLDGDASPALVEGADGNLYIITLSYDDTLHYSVYSVDPATSSTSLVATDTNGSSSQMAVATGSSGIWLNNSGTIDLLPYGSTTVSTVATVAGASGPLAQAGRYLYVSTGSSILQVDTLTGTTVTVAGGQQDENGDPVYGYADGKGTAAEFDSPTALLSDGSTTIWTLDNNRARALLLGRPVQVAVQHVSPLGGAVSPAQTYGGPDLSAKCDCATPTVDKQGIEPSDGDIVESYLDISVPGPGLPLDLTRTYDSGLAQQQALGSSPTPVGPIGFGWSYNLGMSLAEDPSTGEVTIDQEDGSQISFSPYVAGTSPSWCLGTTNYCPVSARDLATLDENNDGTWTFVRYSGDEPETFTFSAAGALSSEADEQGDTLASAPGTPGSGGCPVSASECTVWTSSASGRSLTLAFDASGRLSSATASGGETVTYCYFGEACAGGASAGASEDLYSATVPGQGTTTYAYDVTNQDADLDHDIVSESLPSGGTVTNTYDSAGQVVAQDAPSDDVTLSYSGDNQSVDGGSTVVSTWPAGTSGPVAPEVTQYDFSSGALVGETTGYGTASASTEYFDLDPTSLVPTTVQDGDSNQSTATLDSSSDPMAAGNVALSTDAMGNTTEYQYTADNQVWCEVQPSEYLDGVRCPSSEPSSPPSPGAADPDQGATISYYNSDGLLVAETDALGNTTTYSYTSGAAGVPDDLQYCSVGPVAYQAGVTCPAYGASHVSGTTTSTFDSAGDQTSSTDADGATTTYTYGASGHPGLVSSSTSPEGTTTSYTYNSAGQVTSETQSFNSYSATTLYAYDSAGNQYCSVAPAEVAAGVTCPSSPPATPPTVGDDAYLGATITSFNGDGQAIQATNPLGGITLTAYDQAGQAYCSVAPAEVAAGVTCPSSPPATPPTVGDDAYLGATITSFNADGQAVQVTNPLGGITLTSYDADGNVVSTTVESSDPSTDANVVTAYAYDADDQVIQTTLAPGTAASATTLSSYDPDGNVYCSVSANAYASGTYQCPPWQASWAATPPGPASLYSATPIASQAEDVTTTFYDADGNELQSTDADGHTSVNAYDADGRTYCSADATNVDAWVGADPSGAYPYLCPASAPSTPPAPGSDPGYETTIYDPAGLTLASSDQVGDTTSYTYSPGGQVLTTTNANGDVTTNCYYYQGAAGQCAHGAPASGGSGEDLYSVTTPATAADPDGDTTTTTYYPGARPMRPPPPPGPPPIPTTPTGT